MDENSECNWQYAQHSINMYCKANCGLLLLFVLDMFATQFLLPHYYHGFLFTWICAIIFGSYIVCLKFLPGKWYRSYDEKSDHYLLLVDVQRAGSPVTGLPYALAGLTLSQSFSLDLLQVTAMVTIAELWLDLGVGHAAQALLLLYQCLPIVLGHGGLELRARTNLAVARCHLSNPSFSGWS